MKFDSTFLYYQHTYVVVFGIYAGKKQLRDDELTTESSFWHVNQSETEFRASSLKSVCLEEQNTKHIFYEDN